MPEIPTAILIGADRVVIDKFRRGFVGPSGENDLNRIGSARVRTRTASSLGGFPRGNPLEDSPNLETSARTISKSRAAKRSRDRRS